MRPSPWPGQIAPCSALRRPQPAPPNTQQRVQGPAGAGSAAREACPARAPPRPSVSRRSVPSRPSSGRQRRQWVDRRRARTSTASGLPCGHRAAARTLQQTPGPDAPPAGLQATAPAVEHFGVQRGGAMNGVGGFGMAPATGVAPVAPSSEQRVRAAARAARTPRLPGSPCSCCCCRRARCPLVAATPQPPRCSAASGTPTCLAAAATGALWHSDPPPLRFAGPPPPRRPCASGS